MYKILVLLFIPFSSFASFTFYELPSSFDKISELKSKYYSWGFDDWEEMQKDPDVSSEDYSQFIGTRCGGLFLAKMYINDYTDSELHTSLQKKRNMMTDIIRGNLEAPFNFKQAKFEMDTLMLREYMYRNYYLNILEFVQKHRTKLESLDEDIEICERFYKINSEV